MKLSDWEQATPDEINRMIHHIILKETSEPIPNYTGDVEQALQLANRKDILLRPNMFGTGPWCAGTVKRVTFDDKTIVCEYPIWGATPALAICRAALNWRTQMEAEGWIETPIGWVK